MSVTVLAAWLVASLIALRGLRTIRFVRDEAPLDDDSPGVTVVIAARNEERDIEAALRSVLALDYGRIEVVAVNDRSTDATGAILDRMAAADDRLRVVHVTELPPRWLGKCHALHAGAMSATTELVLFTDADVHFAPDALARAVGFLARGRLDHVALMPDLRMPGPILQTFAPVFAIGFSAFTRPWKARDPKSRAHLGIGAFNLVRRAAYIERGGHAPIAMRPDDDLRLGRLMKSAGGRQDVLFGKDAVWVAWYQSLGEVVRGLTKNAFSAFDYHLSAVIGATLMQALLCLWPFIGLGVTRGPSQIANVLTVLIITALFVETSRTCTTRPWYALGFPFAVLVLIYVTWRSTLVTLVRGGVVWRDTFYPLSDLRS